MTPTVNYFTLTKLSLMLSFHYSVLTPFQSFQAQSIKTFSLEIFSFIL